MSRLRQNALPGEIFGVLSCARVEGIFITIVTFAFIENSELVAIFALIHTTDNIGHLTNLCEWGERVIKKRIKRDVLYWLLLLLGFRFNSQLELLRAARAWTSQLFVILLCDRC